VAPLIRNALAAYAAIKNQFARDYAEAFLAYPKAKTAFIQELVDKARVERGLSRSLAGMIE